MKGLIMIKVNIILLVAMFLGVSGYSSYLASAANDGGTPSKGAEDASLLSRQQAERMAQDRRQIIAQLLAIAQKKISPEDRTPSSPQVLAIGLLGDYRAEEAVAFLIANIELFVAQTSDELVPGANYPCAAALVKIGLPSVKGILNRLDSVATEKELKLFATVIRLVDGDEVGLLRIEHATTKATEKSKDNLAALMKIYKNKEFQY